LFTAALDEDSTFTMAAFYAGRTAHVHSGDSLTKYLARAEQLSVHAPEFERLLINAYVAHWYNEPRELAVAETLAVRYLNAPEAAVRLAVARYWHGDFLGAVAEHQRVLALHPTLPKASRQNCDACVEAYNGIIVAYWAADSLQAAVRVARQWTKHSPEAPAAWTTLATVLEYADLYREAGAAREKAAALAPPNVLSDLARVPGYLRAGDFAAADRLLDVAVQSIDATVAREAAWWQVVSFRYQGRYAAALRAALRFRQLEEARGNRAAARIAQAAVLQDAGKTALAAASYDSLVQLLPDHGRASRNARERAWWLTHVGDAVAAAGDTARLVQLVDSVKLVGARSGYGRDPRLYHHLRGLVYQARGDLPAAETEFRAAIYSTTAGYTRTNLALARVLIERDQPRAAVRLLQAALRGSLDGSPFYVTRTELHETLARAWEHAGQRDSAAYHYGRVVKAWQNAEPPLHRRRQELETRLAASR
jgi:tetratricopeptide (TPR) repeat protein